MVFTLEKMTAEHQTPVIDIFNHYIEHSFAAYLENKVPYELFHMLMNVAEKFPAVVARDDSGQVVAFALLRPYHSMPAFRHTAEITYFIAPERTGQGLGRLLLDRLETEARNAGLERLLADISSLNEGSINFHRKNGFRECGRFEKVGRKFGRDFDQVWMQKEL